MEQLFKVLKKRYPSSEVVDIKFSIDNTFIGPVEPISILDKKLATALNEADEIDITTFLIRRY